MTSTTERQAKALIILPTLWRNGAVTAMLDLGERLQDRGLAIELFVLREIPNGAFPADTMLNTRYGLPLEDLSNWHERIKPRIPKVKGLVKRIGAGWDRIKLLLRLVGYSGHAELIVVTWENGDALGLPAVAAFVRRKASVVILQSNIQHSLQQYPKFPGLVGLRIACARARRVVCVSEDLVPIAREQLRIPSERIVGITHGVDLAALARKARGPVPETAKHLDPPFVVALGRLAPEKGFSVLIEAHARVLHAGFSNRLVFIGQGERAPLERLAQRLGVADTVIFLGYLPNPFPVVARASVVCVSSYYEGKSVALLEAAALGVPMISTDCEVGPRETLLGGKYGRLVPTGSVEAMTEAICDHLAHPEELEQRAAWSARDGDRLSIERTVDRYESLFEQLASR